MMNLEGQTLGRYRIIEKLGRGGMAVVYKAYHPQLDRYVALKVLQSYLVEGEDFQARFNREAKAVAKLRHPSIVQVYDFDVHEELPFMVMEYIEGTTLKALLSEYSRKGEVLSFTQISTLFRQIADALEYAHQKNLFHRDIKPANVLIDKQGHAFLADFGIARIASDTAFTASGAFLGTPSYIAPEQAMGHEVTKACDIYSLGIVLYELSTGKVPFEADTPFAVIQQHISASLPRPTKLRPEMPEPLERVIMRALAKEPQDRFESAAQMAEAVEQALTDTGATRLGEVVAAEVSARQPTAVELPETLVAPESAVTEIQPERRRPIPKSLPLLAAGGVLIVALGLLGIRILGGGGSSLGKAEVRPTAPPAATQVQRQSASEPEPSEAVAAVEVAPTEIVQAFPVRIRLRTASDWSSLDLSVGGDWADLRVVSQSDGLNVDLSQPKQVNLNQACVREQDCRELEAVIDLTLLVTEPVQAFVFKIDRGAWGWTEWELMNVLGPGPVTIDSYLHDRDIPGGVARRVEWRWVANPLVAWIEMGQSRQGSGMALARSQGDGLHQVVELGGSVARQTVPMEPGQPGSYLYFTVDDDFYLDEHLRVEIVVEYFDNGREAIDLQYDSVPAGSTGAIELIFKHVHLVDRTNSGTWKTVTIVLEDASFANHQHDYADFRLATDMTPLAIRYVEIRVIP